MDETWTVLLNEYTIALNAYLLNGGEDARLHAYDLGRRALSQGLGVVGLAALHHQALVETLRRNPDITLDPRLCDAMGEFLEEALSPFEITHRGYREATRSLQKVYSLAAMLCHEIRTPLTSIVASAGLLQEVRQFDAESAESQLLANIREGARILEARTAELVDIVGLVSGSLKLNLAPLRLGPFLREVCQRLEPVVIQAGMQLRANLPDHLPVVRADPMRLEQVIANLVQNAAKYGADGPWVDVRARQINHRLCIEVQDYGRGISSWNRKRLFQPGFRVEDTAQSISGLGLGLALCKQLVEAHGGTIDLANQEGEGALFRIRLPLLQRASARTRRQKAYESTHS